MKNLLTFSLSLLLLTATHAQLPLKGNWSRALLDKPTVQFSMLSGDTIHKSISVIQADSLITANDTNSRFIIIDVRTHDEYIAGHLKEAENIDFYDSTFNEQINELDRDKIYLVYCFAGTRSAQAYALMVSMKFREVYEMKGGFKKWKSDGYPYEVDTATSIKRYASHSGKVIVYPNPANEKLMIYVSDLQNNCRINLYDANGQELFSQMMIDDNTEINIRTLGKGVYFLRLQSGNSFTTEKFIKQ